MPALRMIALAHLAFDVPKHLTHDQVFSALRTLSVEARVHAGSVKASEALLEDMHFCDPDLRRAPLYDILAAKMDLRIRNKILGHVWIPGNVVVLGAEAGNRIGEIILSMKYGDRLDTRTIRGQRIEQAIGHVAV